ncbi:MAG: hypothetical protein PHD67_11140 [Oscillospiraceae bacterium]|nr:hypothetical protein [Oscillospiraceae bacterium]
MKRKMNCAVLLLVAALLVAGLTACNNTETPAEPVGQTASESSSTQPESRPQESSSASPASSSQASSAVESSSESKPVESSSQQGTAARSSSAASVSSSTVEQPSSVSISEVPQKPSSSSAPVSSTPEPQKPASEPPETEPEQKPDPEPEPPSEAAESGGWTQEKVDEVVAIGIEYGEGKGWKYIPDSTPSNSSWDNPINTDYIPYNVAKEDIKGMADYLEQTMGKTAAKTKHFGVYAEDCGGYWEIYLLY